MQSEWVRSLSHVQLFATPWTVATMLLHPWDFPGKRTGVDCLLQGIFLTQGSNPGLPHFRQMLYRLSHQGTPEYIMRNARLDETQGGIKISRWNINNLRYADDTTLMAESKEELKSLLVKVKEESEKAGLKQHSKNEVHGLQPHHFMANRWGNSDRLYFLGSKITADGDCSHEIKRCLLFGRKTMTKIRQHIKKLEILLCQQWSIQSKLWFFQ